MLPEGPGGRAAPDTVRDMRRTKIVATIGPASREPETLVRLVEAGMDVARLNYSHGTLDEHAETVLRVRDAAGRAGRPVAILQDLPGPKLRIGPLHEGVVELTAGETLTILCGDGAEPGDARRMSISWDGLAEAVEPDSIIYLADGSVRLRVTAVREADCEVDTEIEVGGAVASRQGLNIPGPVDALPAVPEEDLALLSHGESIGVDMVALSFVRSPHGCAHGARSHAPPADREDREAAGRRAREGDHRRGRLRDGRAWRSRHRAADRPGPRGAEAASRARGPEGAALDHRHADARLDGELLTARREPRSRTWRTRSSTGRTR